MTNGSGNIKSLITAEQARDNNDIYFNQCKSRMLSDLNADIIYLSRQGKRSMIIKKEVGDILFKELVDAGYDCSFHRYGPYRVTKLLIEW